MKVSLPLPIMIAATLSMKVALPAKTSNWKSSRMRSSNRLPAKALLFVEKIDGSTEKETKSNGPYSANLVSGGIFNDETDDPNLFLPLLLETPGSIISKQLKD